MYCHFNWFSGVMELKLAAIRASSDLSSPKNCRRFRAAPIRKSDLNASFSASDFRADVVHNVVAARISDKLNGSRLSVALLGFTALSLQV